MRDTWFSLGKSIICDSHSGFSVCMCVCVFASVTNGNKFWPVAAAAAACFLCTLRGGVVAQIVN